MIQRFYHLLKGRDFVFAKTMPEYPHYYTLKKNWGKDAAKFEEAVMFIRKNGYKETFKGREYTMFNLNGFKYWTMGAPLSETTLINAAKVSYQSDYDNIAVEYEKMFSTPEYKAEDREIISMIDIRGRVLDIGCGSGLLLDNVKINPLLYSGIDPSIGMLDLLAKKHPTFKGRVFNTNFEDFYNGEYDTIVCLYGTCSYIDPEVLISRIKSMSKKTTKVFLMFYKNGYNPVTHVKTGINPYIYQNNLPGKIYGNYKITTENDI